MAATTELMPIRPDLTTVLACLLHDSVDDGTAQIAEVESAFGSEVARIIAEIGNIGKIKYR